MAAANGGSLRGAAATGALALCGRPLCAAARGRPPSTRSADEQAEARREKARNWYWRNRERVLERMKSARRAPARRPRAARQGGAAAAAAAAVAAASAAAAKEAVPPPSSAAAHGLSVRSAAQMLIAHRPDTVGLYRPTPPLQSHTVVLSALSPAHMWQIADPLVRMADSHEVTRVDGSDGGGTDWMVLDFGSLVVHMYIEGSDELEAARQQMRPNHMAGAGAGPGAASGHAALEEALEALPETIVGPCQIIERRALR